MIYMMKLTSWSINRIWNIRNKIKKGELPNDYLSDIRDVLEDYIKQGRR